MNALNTLNLNVNFAGGMAISAIYDCARDECLRSFHLASQALCFGTPAHKNVSSLWDNLAPEAIAQIFETKFTATQCKVSEEDGAGAPAVYTNFLNFPGEGRSTFENTISLRKGRSEDESRVSLIHEKLHAIQWNAIPELHASPYNQLAHQEVPIILSPRSWVLMTLLTERDAYAKTAWLSHLALNKSYCEQFAAAAGAEIVNQHDVAYWHGRFPDDIGFALGEASLVWDDKIKVKARKNDPDVRLHDHYIDRALDMYENSFRLHKSPTAAQPIFVDLDDAGILALGASFGPSIFGKHTPDPVFKTLKLNEEQEQRLEALNVKLGIDPSQDLPTLDEALSGLGSNRAAYIERSKAYIDRGVEPSFKAGPEI